MRRFSRRSFLRVGCGSVAVGLAGCAGSDSEGTPSRSRSPSGGQDTVSSYQYGSARTGVVNTTLPGADATEQWQTDPEVQNAIVLQWAAVDQQRVYAALQTFGHFPSAVVALDRETGAIQWKDETGGSAPALVDDTLYIADNRVRALAAGDGSERWVAGPEAEYGVPAVVDGRVYATTGRRMYAFDAADGSVLWSTKQDGNVGSAVAVADGTVYAGHASPPDDGRNGVAAFDTADGSSEWTVTIPSGVVAAPAVADGVVYVSDGGTLFALDAADGTERWRQSLGEYIGLSSPAVANGRVYVRTQNRVAAYELDGSTVWDQSVRRTGGSFQYHITVAGESLVVPGLQALEVHDAATGTKQYELPVAAGGAVVLDGTVYGATDARTGTFKITALQR